jgi:anti-anti-sigma regulatory factor
VILDLQDVGFFGTQGFSVLCTINERCAHASVNWTLVSGRAVSHVLEICDPDHTLPIAKS